MSFLFLLGFISTILLSKRKNEGTLYNMTGVFPGSATDVSLTLIANSRRKSLDFFSMWHSPSWYSVLIWYGLEVTEVK